MVGRIGSICEVMGRVKLLPRIVDGLGGAGGGAPDCHPEVGGNARVFAVCGESSGDMTDG